MFRASPAPRILVVDDNEDNRYTLARRLRRLGCDDVREATNGREALEAIDAERFDLVFLDIMMPEVSGYEVLEQLRARGRLGTLPVIVISALDEIESAARCIELGAEDYLTKPFNPTLLRARLQSTLEKKGLRDEVARQLAVIEEVFGRYVPSAVARAIVAGEGALEPMHREATILYTDIESFTSIAEGLAPAHVVQMLNEYFPAVIEPINEQGGVVNQFQGDAMLITFNVPVPDEAHAERAVAAARAIQQISATREFAGIRLRTRIGINTGPVVAGNVGSGERMNYTVHGDAVNLAARLEQLNKELGTLAIASGSTVERLGAEHGLAPLGVVPIRGKDEGVPIFQVV